MAAISLQVSLLQAPVELPAYKYNFQSPAIIQSLLRFFLIISQPIPQPIINANTITVINNHSGGKDKSSFMLVVLGNYGLNS